MRNPFKRKRKEAYVMERERLLYTMETMDPSSDEYHTVMNRLEQLDKILNRTSELTNTVIPAMGTMLGVSAIYGVQQFAGVLIPKALDSIAARQQQKKSEQDD